MTAPKVTLTGLSRQIDGTRLDATIEWAKHKVHCVDPIDWPYYETILATLQSIKDAGDDVVAPLNVYFEHDGTGKLVIENAVNHGGIKERFVSKHDYDTLLAKYKRACVERDIERGRSATKAVEGLAGCFYKPNAENPRWYRPSSLSELRGFYKGALLRMIPAARKCGYALGVHGSMQRDLDLIAAPWVANHADKNELAKQLQIAACGIHADSYQWGAHEKKAMRSSGDSVRYLLTRFWQRNCKSGVR